MFSILITYFALDFKLQKCCFIAQVRYNISFSYFSFFYVEVLGTDDSSRGEDGDVITNGTRKIDECNQVI